MVKTKGREGGRTRYRGRRSKNWKRSTVRRPKQAGDDD